MPDLRETHRKVKIALAAMTLVDVAAVVMYFSPLIGSASSRQAQLQQLWQELQQKTHEVAPLRGLDKKIPAAQQQISKFYQTRFPAAASAMAENIDKLAAQSGVTIASVKYDEKDPEMLGLQRVQIDADLAGDYLQLVRFINSLERDPMFFLVDGVQLGGEQGGVVRLQMKVETYLKTGAA
ncbi:MAG TPA: type 4a pilus biogenesis protein PilO [Terriglobales bacterium]|nr:type 4a pilus biogenesis protein PilO [Terriglobales bacterium]